MPQYGFRKTTKPRNHETKKHETTKHARLMRLTGFVRFVQFREKRLTITDEAAVVMGISGDLQSPQKWSKPRAL